MTKLALHWQILIAILLAVAAGWAVNFAGAGDPAAPNLFGVPFLAVFDYIGKMFLNALKMIIVPLIMSSIIVGMAGIGSSGNLGALGGRTLGFYLSTSVAAIVLGLVLVNLVKPGIIDGEPVGDLLALDVSASQVAEQVGDRGAGDVADLFLRMIPENVILAAANGEMLALIFFSLLFGYFMTRIGHDLADILYKFWDGVFNVMMRMTEWIMKFAPIGVFGLVAAVVAETGFAAAQPLVVFALVVLAGLAGPAAATDAPHTSERSHEAGPTASPSASRPTANSMNGTNLGTDKLEPRIVSSASWPRSTLPAAYRSRSMSPTLALRQDCLFSWNQMMARNFRTALMPVSHHMLGMADSGIAPSNRRKNASGVIAVHTSRSAISLWRNEVIPSLNRVVMSFQFMFLFPAAWLTYSSSLTQLRHSAPV